MDAENTNTTTSRGMENRMHFGVENRMHLCQLNKTYKGARMRKCGKWVAEIHDSVSNKRIWLGTYNTPVAAARAYDVALFYLRGPEVKLNFPEWMVGDDQHHQLSLDEVRNRAVQVGRRVDELQVQMRFESTLSTNMTLNLINRESDVHITADSQMSLNEIDREPDVYITSDLNEYPEITLNQIDRESDVYVTPDLNKDPQMSLNPIDRESGVYITPDLNECLEMSLNSIDHQSVDYITPDLNKYPEMSLNVIDHKLDVYIMPDLNKLPQL